MACNLLYPGLLCPSHCNDINHQICQRKAATHSQQWASVKHPMLHYVTFFWVMTLQEEDAFLTSLSAHLCTGYVLTTCSVCKHLFGHLLMILFAGNVKRCCWAVSCKEQSAITILYWEECDVSSPLPVIFLASPNLLVRQQHSFNN